MRCRCTWDDTMALAAKKSREGTHRTACWFSSAAERDGTRLEYPQPARRSWGCRYIAGCRGLAAPETPARGEGVCTWGGGVEKPTCQHAWDGNPLP
jgi:hypothetical protein